MSLLKGYQTEHSPIRTQIFWVEMNGIESFVSTHFVRHKIGVEHYVKSNRDDLTGSNEVIDRNTLVNHAMLINSAALISMARKRLCLKSHRKTTAVMAKIVHEIMGIDLDLYKYLVPECVYRNKFCPEVKECPAGLNKVYAAYIRRNKECQNH